jgi:hypothetical protein
MSAHRFAAFLKCEGAGGVVIPHSLMEKKGKEAV